MSNKYIAEGNNMKYQISKFTEFLKTPFPYLFLALCLFLATTLLGNAGFRNALQQNDSAIQTKSADKYELCLVCSGPGAHDALSDIGFTVANFILFPVTLATTGLTDLVSRVEPVTNGFVYAAYLTLSLLYGLVLPFLIFVAYEAFDSWLVKNTTSPSVYHG